MTLLSFPRANARRLCAVRILVRALSMGLISFWVVAPVSAATFTWTGTGSNGNWGDIFQWSGLSAPPTNGFNTDIVMQGSDTSPDIQNIFNNNVDYDIDSITLSSSYTGGTMFLAGGELTVDNEIVNNDGSEFEFNSVTRLGDQTLGIRANNGNIDFDAAVEVFLTNSTINVTGGRSVFFDGGISRDFGAIIDTTLNIFNDTFVRIGGDSSPLGTVNIFDGTLQINSISNLPTAVNVSVSSGSIFDLNNFNENIDRLTGSGSVDLGTATLTLGDTTDFSFFGSISGTGGITLNQSGTMTLEGNNFYTGATSITGGTIQLNGSGRLSNSTDVSVTGSGTFDLNGVSDQVDSISGNGTIRLGGGILTVDETAGTRTFSGNILESGEMQKNGNGTLVLSGSNTFTLLDINQGTVRVSSQGNLGIGTIELGAGTLQTTATFSNARAMTTNSSVATINVNSGSTFTQSSTISGVGGITKQGNGTLALGASNTYTGDTMIFDGVVRLNGSNRISNSSDVEMISGATLQLQSFSDTVNSLSGTGGSVTTTGSGRLTVNAASGTFTWGGSISGTGGFTKAGNHTMIVSAFQSYSGSTNINDGLLRFTGNGDFSSASDITVASGATWDLNGLSDLVDSINGAGSILLGGATLSVDENGAPRTFSGIISEAGNFAKNGTGTLILSGNNSYSGTTTLDNGVLRVASSSNLGSGSLIFDNGTLNTTGSFTNSRAVTINANDSAFFDVNSLTTLTQSGTITGASTTTLIKNGTGTFRTTSANSGTFSGDIVINAGTFDMAGGGNALGNSTTVTVNGTGTFLVNNADDIGGLNGSGSVVLNQILRIGHDNASNTFSGVISGASIFGKRGTGTQTLTGNNTYTGSTDIDGGVLRLSGGGRLSDLTDVNVVAGATLDLNDITDTIDALSGAGSVTLGAGSNTLTVGGNNGSGAFSGTISESGSFIKLGTGTQTLSGNNTWNQGTQINGGTLRVSSATTNLGNGGLSLDGGTLEITATGNNFKSIVLNAGGGTIDVDSGTTFTMAAATPFSGVGALTKSDTGTLVITASNTYLGDTNITGGVLRHGVGGRLSDLSDVLVSGGATWDLNGQTDTVKSIAGAGDIMLGGATLTVNQNGGSTIFSGVLSEAGGLVKGGTHQLTLTGVNTYTGNTAINGGILQINADSGLGDASATLSFDGGTLQSFFTNTIDRVTTLNAGGGTISPASIFVPTTITMTGNISGSGGLTKTGFGAQPNRLVLSGTNTYLGGTFVNFDTLQVANNANLGANVGDVTLTGSTLNTTGSFENLHAIVLAGSGGTLDVNGGTILTQSVGISGSGDLIKEGTGTLLLTAPATHAGDTFITGGLLQFGSGELPDAFDMTVSSLAVWDLNGVSDAIDGLQGTGTILLGGGTLTVGSDGGDGNFSGSIQEAGGFTKTGNGTQILSGANTYTATTIIDQGTLEITDDGSLGAASATLVFNDGTLRTTSTFTTGRTTTINFVGDFETVASTTLTFTSPIGGASGDLIKSGLGTLELTQPNTYGGITQIDVGTLQLSGGGLLPETEVQVASGATLDVTDIVDDIDALGGNGTVLLGLGTLTVGADDGSDTFSGVISGTGGAIVKAGSGTQTFSGTNIYTGGTFLNDGVLRINQSENLGALGTLLSFDGGTLNTTATFSMIRGISLEAGGGTFDVNAATTLNASGNITGAGSLTKIGDGTLVLSGFSTYLGGTNVNGGTVEINSAVNLGSTLGPLTLDNGTLQTTNNITTPRPTIIGPGSATFDTDGSTMLTLSGLISGNAGANGFTKAGAGTLRLQAANTFSAATRIAGGVLQVDASNQLGNGGNTIDLVGGSLNTLASLTNPRVVRIGVGGGGLNVAGGTTLTQSGVIQDDTVGPFGGLAKDGAGTLLSTASNTYSGPTAINAGTLRLAGAGQLPDVTDVSVAGGALFDLNNVSDTIDALSGSGDVTFGSGSLTVGSDDGSGTFNGTISGTGGLTKTGTGTQTLRTKTIGMSNFPNTYTGGTVINEGVLDVEDDENLGAPAGSLSFNGGTLLVQGDMSSFNTTRVVTLDAGGGTLNTAGEALMDFGGVIGGTGSITKTGVGTLTLSANNTYTGETIINQGLVRLQGSGSIPDASSVTVNAVAGGMTPGGLDLNGIDDAIDALAGVGDIDLGSATLTIGSANGGDEFEGAIEGSGGIVKVGTGAQIFSGASTYTGGTAINGGILEIDANNRLGNPTGPLSFDSGTLATGGTFSMTRATTLNAGGGTLNVAGANTLTHTAVISGIGGLGKSNSGTLVLSGINTYTGPTNVTGGTLRLGGIERLANQTAVSVSGGAVFDLNNFNESIDAISGAGSIVLGTAQLVVGLNNGSGTFSGMISGTGDLLKEGTGIQTLSGVNTYSGATFVDRGTLILSGGGSIDQATLITGFNIGADGTTTVDGSATTWDLSGNLFVGFDGTGRMNINNGATVTVDGNVTVGGNGIAGTLSLGGGTLDNSAGSGITITTGMLQGQGTVTGDIFNQDMVAPGNSAGILTLTGNYSQDVTGLFSVEIGGADNSDLLNPEFDFFDISGTAGLAGELELALISGFTPTPTDSFTILSSSALAGVFSNVADGARLNLLAGGTGSFQVDYTANSIVLSDFMGIGSSFSADFDNDGDVDGDDLSDPIDGWEARFGVDLDGGNFLDWQRQFGSGVGPLATSESVPEPSAMGLVLIALAGMTLKRNLQRRP